MSKQLEREIEFPGEFPDNEHLDAAVDWLLDHQAEDGWWTAELETNVTMTAEHVLLLAFLGIELDSIRDGAIRHILQHQRDDGSWALYHDGPADLSTTIEAYVALRVLGIDPGNETMQRALTLIRRLGGVAQARVFTKIWLALFGQYPWQGIPSMPPELIHLPPQLPFNLYDFACWARGTIAPLLIVLSRRPVRSLGFGLPELINPGTEKQLFVVPGNGAFWWTDVLQKLYESLPRQPGRTAARRQLVDWIAGHQEADGGWGGIQPPWVYSLIALQLEGMGLDHPVMQRGLRGLDGFALEDRGGWRLQACMSPIWDSAWALMALRRAGLPREHFAIRRGVRWLLEEQVSGGGDWQIRARGAEGAGWAFEFQNDIYPDIDDTAVVVLALLEAGHIDEIAEPVNRAMRWMRAMRCRNGAWAGFDKDNTSEIVYRLPFADFGALLDPPSEDVTAHVVEALARTGSPSGDPDLASGLAYLRDTQRPDGSWWGRWGVNFIYGTWCTVSALTALEPGAEAGDMIEKARGWLISRQNVDGGWGETCYSYEDESFAGIGESTPSQTAWALLSLQAAGDTESAAHARGIEFLQDRQIDGTWDEPQFTGTGFPRDFYINYHMYRHLFPTMALAGATSRGEL
ncbi:MAG: squalene--hopene cyclase [Chloroflexota bacterium]